MKILVTAGPVYGRLDDNKLVSNRSRGIWAEQFGYFLFHCGHAVTLVVPDIYRSERISHPRLPPAWCEVIRHTGFDDYRRICTRLAPDMDAAVMASAVVNWIPAEPIKGKMATKGYKVGDRINIPFYLAPHVIDEMRVANPKLTLIGCKMLVNCTTDELVTAAYDLVLRAKCNVVVANDLVDLHTKKLVYQDRTVVSHHMGEPEDFYKELQAVIQDQHYCTELKFGPWPFPRPSFLQAAANPEYRDIFADIVDKYRDRFNKRSEGVDRVFGAVCVPWENLSGERAFQVSPREKGSMFTSGDSVAVMKVENRGVHAIGPAKATLNAPLLIRVAQKYNQPVLHLHEHLEGVPTVPYAPPGTVRDNDRPIPGPAFNIEGHGFVACLDDDLNIRLQ